KHTCIPAQMIGNSGVGHLRKVVEVKSSQQPRPCQCPPGKKRREKDAARGAIDDSASQYDRDHPGGKGKTEVITPSLYHYEHKWQEYGGEDNGLESRNSKDNQLTDDSGGEIHAPATHDAEGQQKRIERLSQFA